MRPTALVILVLTTLGFGFCVLITLPMLMISPVVFDRPERAASPLTWLVIAGLWSFPPLVLYGLARAWRAFRRQAHREALLALWIPAFAFAWMAGAWSLWSVVCPPSGELGCM